MASMLDKKKQVSEDGTNKYGFFIVLVFLIWLFFPTKNNFAQLSCWAYNITYKVSKMMNIETPPQYIHVRNNAVYKAKINPKKSRPALEEFDKAFALVSGEDKTREQSILLSDRAVVKIFYGDRAGAIEDLENAEFLEKDGSFRLSLLLADMGEYDEAGEICKELVTKNNNAILGYVCYAHIYEKKGETESAKRIFNWLANKKPDNALVYTERAFFKKRMNDENGFAEDMKRAKETSPNLLMPKTSMIEDAVYFKHLPLQIK